MNMKLFNRWVPFFDKQERELQPDGESAGEAKAKMERILDAAPVAYALVAGSMLAEVNAYARQQIGMEPGQDIRPFCEDIEPWNRLINGAGHDQQATIRIKMKSGETRRFLCHVTAIDCQQQEAHILWAIDIEESEIKAEQLLDTEKKLQAANRLEGNIFAGISREIGPPINSITSLTDRILAEKNTDRQMQYVTDIKKTADSLQSIIDITSDYGKISEGNLHAVPTDIELGVFLRSIVSMTRFSAHTKGLEFIEEMHVKTPEYVKMDAVRVKQVLLNLLSNAVKYTKAGSVTFSVKIEAGNLLFEVSDTGIGVRHEDIPQLFKAFNRVDRLKNRLIKGAGLGLAISEKLIDIMGGKIWLESEYGVGSRFYVTIPYEPGDKTVNKSAATDLVHIYAPTANVLLVDDIQSNLTVTSGLLRLCGITADVALSGMEAINLAREKDYDIIFMDYMMPEMNGVEAMKKIRALRERYAKLPIIALTAGADDESRDFLLGEGMNDFLSKPLDKNALMNVLKKWMPAGKLESVGGHDTTSQSKVYSDILHAVSMIEDVDVELALNRISGMQDVLEKSLMQVAKALGGHLREMDEYLSANNLKDFSVTVHGIKGALANIGAMRYSELAAELEILSKAGNTPQCKVRFAVFADMLAKLDSKLNAIFSPAATKNLPQGDRALLTQKAEAAVSFLEEYEISAAQACISEMLAFSYGEATDRLLNDISDAVAAANYKKAIALFKGSDL